MAIGLGVIGMNPTNMGSTATLLKDVPDLKYELRGMCAKRADVLENYANQIGVDFWTTDYRELVQRDDISVVAIYSPTTCMPSIASLRLKPVSMSFAQSRW